MYNAIIPEKCEFVVTNRLELKLAKQKSIVHWRTLHDEKV